MSYRVKSLEVFERQAKILNKKYPSLKSELVSLVELLKVKPTDKELKELLQYIAF